MRIIQREAKRVIAIILQLCILYVNSKRVRGGGTSISKSFKDFHATETTYY